VQFEDVGVEPAVKLRATALGTARNVVGDGSSAEFVENALRQRNLAASGGALGQAGRQRRLDARNPMSAPCGRISQHT
jgi:hypothetical protein